MLTLNRHPLNARRGGTRQRGHSFTIGDAKVTILSVRGERVHVGIEAPGQDVKRDDMRHDKAKRPIKAEGGGADT